MTKKKIFIAVLATAIPAAFVAACVKAANRLVDEAEEVEGDDAACSESIEDDGEKETPNIDNEVKWWTGSHATNDRRLHSVRLSTTAPLASEEFECFTRMCREYATAKEAVGSAMRFLYDCGYTIVDCYVWDSN